MESLLHCLGSHAEGGQSSPSALQMSLLSNNVSGREGGKKQVGLDRLFVQGS